MDKKTKFKCAYHRDCIEEDGFGGLLECLTNAQQVPDKSLRLLFAGFAEEVKSLRMRFASETTKWRVTDEDVVDNEELYRG